jgi:acetoacetate decarboxylase
LAMYMDSDSAVMFGRDTFGEPKKLASVRLSHTSRRVAGSIVRHGVELFAADVSLENDDGPVKSTSWAFNVKSWPSADGTGLQSDALLTATKFDTELWTNWSGAGTLRFGSTAHDPLGEIPIVRILQAGYYEGDHSTSSQVVAIIPALTFLPYAYGRDDDWSADFPQSSTFNS